MRLSTAERRARLGRRHHLASPAAAVEQVAGDLCGLHSSDPGSVYLSAWARVGDFAVADLEAALYDQRSLVRMLGMRRTMFVVPTDLAAVMDAACTQALAPPERRRLEGMVAEQGLAADAGPWLADVEARVLEALARRGEATAVQLTEDVPELGLRLSFGEGKTWGGTQGLSTRILFLLATEARIVRGRPLGSWISSQYRWAPTDTWLGGDLAPWDEAEARAELLRRWLRTFGPGTATDLKWWTGWTVAKTKAALAAVEAVEVDLDGGTGWVLPDDLEPVDVPAPWVALLPGLDPTVMGWKDRAWYLGDHGPVLFDTNGNAGPTVWVDGRVVGGWSQDPEGSVVFRLLEDVGADARATVEAEVARLDEWLAGVRVTSRFPTPLQRELAAGP